LWPNRSSSPQAGLRHYKCRLYAIGVSFTSNLYAMLSMLRAMNGPDTLPHDVDQIPWLIVIVLAALIVCGLCVTLALL
jgi:hypothetical protein